MIISPITPKDEFWDEDMKWDAWNYLAEMDDEYNDTQEDV